MSRERSRQEEMLEAIDEAEATEEEEEREAVYRRPQQPRDPAQVYSVRVPADRLEQLRAIARREGLSTSTLVRRLVIDGIERLLGTPDELETLTDRLVQLEARVIELQKEYEGRSSEAVEKVLVAVSLLKGDNP